MPRFRLSFSGLLLLCCLTAAGCAVKVKEDPEKALTSPGTLASLKAVLRDGDWLVMRGLHGTDDFVAAATNHPLSHAGLYDAEKDEVVEALQPAVTTIPLRDFAAKAVRVMVIRPMWATPENTRQAVARARSWIGRPYNLTGLAGLDTPGAYYCTQLAVEAYEPFIPKEPAGSVKPDKKGNPVPKVIQPAQMYHWGTIIYDSGP